MSTVAPTLVPVEEYLRMTDKPYCEYRGGVLFPKSMPTKLHSIIQRVLLALLGARLARRGFEAFPELTLRVSATRYLIPDVAVCADFVGPYPTEAVHLCCEILSPDDRLGATFSKCEEYHEWGVPHGWVIDPVKRSAWEYHAGGEPVRAVEVLAAGEIAIPLRELFASLESAA